jgi:predicted metalloprotease with PDZ domain
VISWHAKMNGNHLSLRGDLFMRSNSLICRKHLRLAVVLASVCAVILAAPVASPRFSAAAQNAAMPAGAPIQISVDLSEAPRHIFHAHLVIPAAPGPLTLLYPKWIPGEHMPDGPISDLVGLRFTAGGKTLPWQRDPVDMWAFHMEVPSGATSVEADLDYLNPVEGSGYSAGPSATAKIVVLEWNDVLLYPAGPKSDDLTYSAHLKLPPGWNFGTSLTTQDKKENETQFAPVSLTALVDSPVLAGSYFRSIPLATDVQPPHHLDLAGDSAASVDIPADELEAYNQLVREAGALFGARHYDHYDFLLSLTDHFSPNGLEHHQSSDNRAPERTLLDPDLRLRFDDLLPHEFAHSWNGKFRRPAGLATPDYNQPMKGDLLWVYEGLTQYLGETLPNRAGLRDGEGYRETLAQTAAYLDHQTGRNWRPLQDTATGAQTLYPVMGDAWFSWRRNVDFYDESWLIWLEADTIIRKQTNGKKSLDDFCRAFHGAPSTGPKLVTYTFDDVVATINQVAPYDWRKFFRDRLDYVGPRAPLGGIDGSGWRLIYNDTPNLYIQAYEHTDGRLDWTYSLGLMLGPNGQVQDVIPEMPGARAGLAPGMRILTINGKAWSPDALHDAVRAAKTGMGPIALQADNEGYTSAYSLTYHGGELYPHLVRDESKPDLLSEILKPLTPVTTPK